MEVITPVLSKDVNRLAKKFKKRITFIRRIQNFLLFSIFLLGILLVSYPKISNWYNQKMGSYVVSQYDKIVTQSNTVNYDDFFDQARVFNESLIDNFINGSIDYVFYENSLNILDGMMGYLLIDSLNIKIPIYHGTDESVLQKAVGHLEGTHLPTGDIGNSTVFTGHTGLPSADLLTNLAYMNVGDTFKIAVLDKIFLYEIFEINTVLPYEIEYLSPISDIDMVTLITCTPYGINSHRLLVHGKQIPFVEEENSSNDVIIIPTETLLTKNDVLIQTIIKILLVSLIILLILSKFIKRTCIISANKDIHTTYKLKFKNKTIILYSSKKGGS